MCTRRRLLWLLNNGHSEHSGVLGFATGSSPNSSISLFKLSVYALVIINIMPLVIRYKIVSCFKGGSLKAEGFGDGLE